MKDIKENGFFELTDEELSKKLAELTENELTQVSGGNELAAYIESCNQSIEAQIIEAEIPKAQISETRAVIDFDPSKIPAVERKIEEIRKKEYMTNHH